MCKSLGAIPVYSGRSNHVHRHSVASEVNSFHGCDAGHVEILLRAVYHASHVMGFAFHLCPVSRIGIFS